MSGSATRDKHGHDGHQLGHDAHHDAADGDAIGHGTLRDYLIGFFLSAILTAAAFWLVMDNVLGKSNLTAIAIMALAAVQIIVHMIYFLHMNTKSEGGWNMLAAIFTIVVVVITLSGSLWIMYHLNTNMMPVHVQHPSMQ